MDVTLELTDTDLNFIKSAERTMGADGVHYAYLEHFLKNLKIVNDEPNLTKFDFPARSKLKSSTTDNNKFEVLEKTLMFNQFTDHLSTNNKIALGLVKFNDDYYLETN